MKIRKNDTVLIVSGKNRGKSGKVRLAFPKNARVLVEGVNFIKRHIRPMRQARQTGIIEREAPIHVSNVMLLCKQCGRPTRIGFQFLEDGRKTRVCRSCHEVID